jgi:hypothetical protein
VKNGPKLERDNLVLLSQSALQLCDISIGDPVIVSVGGVSTVKTAWPTLEKSLISVLLTRSCKLILVANIIKMRSQDSVVDIVTGYGLDDRGVGVRVLVGSRMFSTLSRPALGSTQPCVQCVPGDLSPGVKRAGCETDHLPPTSAKVKKMWIYISIPPYTFVS